MWSLLQGLHECRECDTMHNSRTEGLPALKALGYLAQVENSMGTCNMSNVQNPLNKLALLTKNITLF